MSESRTDANRTIVVGGGVSGLTCAALLHEAGQTVTLLEASDGVGGRIRTDRHPDGFLLDRGFQVILEAYPALQRQVDLTSLNPKPFDAGVLLWTGRRRVPLADPRRHPFALVRDITSRVFPISDKARLASFAAGSRIAAWENAREAALAADVSAEQALLTAGLSDRFIDRFARPFWGGITLDRSLSSSAGPLKFTLKMFLQGSAVLPAAGVQAVPDQLARRLPAQAIELNRRVERIEVADGAVRGVVVDGQMIPATRVVVATDPPAAKSLTGIDSIPIDGVGCVTVYLRGRRDPRIGKKLILDATGNRGINQIVPLSAVAPSYAPPREHLLAVVFIGQEALAESDDEKLVQAARDDVAHILGHEPDNWAMLRVVRTPFAQFAQPPGIYRRLPKVRTETAGLYLAGEMTVDSSLNGAIIGGEQAAKAVLDDAKS